MSWCGFDAGARTLTWYRRRIKLDRRTIGITSRNRLTESTHPLHKPLQIFVSYSHHDSAWTRQLFDEYVPTTQGDCRVWSDAQIRVGDRWDDEIESRLSSSQLAILLVSPNFLKSDFIMKHEYPRIMQRHATDSMRVVWIPVDVTQTKLRTRTPELLQIQGATGLKQPLPPSPDALTETDMIEQVRRHITRQIQAAVDPVGAELSRLVAPRYELQGFLGEGNVACVYKAQDRVLRRSVAVKVLKNKDRREHFMEDVRRATSNSDQPNFINIYDARMDEAATYCVLQHVEGTSLRRRIRDFPTGLPIETIRRIFLGTATALARAHAQGLSYGNIKPSNIMLGLGDEPFILPLGRPADLKRSTRRLEDLRERRRQLQAEGLDLNEDDLEDLYYLVPEHFDVQYEMMDHARSDQYMLGLLIFEMVTGRLPVTLDDAEDVSRDGAAAFKTLPSVKTLRPLCPQRVADIVARMTARRPANRYPNLQTVIDEARLMEDLCLGIARDSYNRCAHQPGFDAEFFPAFYREFLRLCPEAAKHFAKFGDDQWARQHRMLKEAVLWLFAFRQQNESGREYNVLTRLAQLHAGIPATIYDRFVDALMHVVCGHTESGLKAFDPECLAQRAQAELIEEHWRVAIEPAVSHMKRQSAAPT